MLRDLSELTFRERHSLRDLSELPVRERHTLHDLSELPVRERHTLLTVNVTGFLTGDKQIGITAFPCLVGRSRVCRVRLADPYVSGKHCIIDRTASETFTISDLNSRNKTNLNGSELIPGSVYPLKSGDVVRLPGHEITVV